ncbi:hypothetical protein B0H13DRAFT_1858956 [Mycena leptocephala]|nr:hypothetical protein B0H13DRAFT_1858956 [Mycena leptocephala]
MPTSTNHLVGAQSASVLCTGGWGLGDEIARRGCSVTPRRPDLYYNQDATPIPQTSWQGQTQYYYSPLPPQAFTPVQAFPVAPSFRPDFQFQNSFQSSFNPCRSCPCLVCDLACSAPLGDTRWVARTQPRRQRGQQQVLDEIRPRTVRIHGRAVNVRDETKREYKIQETNTAFKALLASACKDRPDHNRGKVYTQIHTATQNYTELHRDCVWSAQLCIGTLPEADQRIVPLVRGSYTACAVDRAAGSTAAFQFSA